MTLAQKLILVVLGIVLLSMIAGRVAAWAFEDDSCIDCLDCDQAYRGVTQCPVHTGHTVVRESLRDIKFDDDQHEQCISSCGHAGCYSVRCNMVGRCMGPAWVAEPEDAKEARLQALDATVLHTHTTADGSTHAWHGHRHRGGCNNFMGPSCEF